MTDALTPQIAGRGMPIPAGLPPTGGGFASVARLPTMPAAGPAGPGIPAQVAATPTIYPAAAPGPQLLNRPTGQGYVPAPTGSVVGPAAVAASDAANAAFSQGDNARGYGLAIRAGAGALGNVVASPFVTAANDIGAVADHASGAVGRFAGGLFGSAPAAAAPLPAQVASPVTGPNAGILPAAGAPTGNGGVGIFNYDKTVGPTVEQAKAIAAYEAQNFPGYTGGQQGIKLAPSALAPAAPTTAVLGPDASAADVARYNASIPAASPGRGMPVAGAPAAPAAKQTDYEKLAGLQAGTVDQMIAHTPINQRAALQSQLAQNAMVLQTAAAKSSVLKSIDDALENAKVKRTNESQDQYADRLAQAYDTHRKAITTFIAPQSALAGLSTLPSQ